MKGLRRLTVIVLGAIVVGLAVNGYLRMRLFGLRMPEGAERGASVREIGDGLTTVAAGLDVPWEVEFLPDGDLLLTERPGRLVRLAPDGARRWSISVPDVVARSEGGLLGLALHPGFVETGWIFLYLTAEGENRIVRYRLGELGELLEGRTLVDGIPAARHHNGGRLAFGPEGLLYATTGDAGDRPAAQDPASLAGKILRLTDEGGIPDGNPFGTLVYSLGHRNPQGLAWDETGVLWVTEHGRSGASSGYDELNRIEAGGNYGWPDAQGDEAPAGIIPPILHSGPEHTWAPSGAAWWQGRVYFGGLRGQSLYEARVAETPVGLVVHFFGDLGRVRQTRIGPDGMLYVLTNNRDGRGTRGDDDDRLMRLAPTALTGGR